MCLSVRIWTVLGTPTDSDMDFISSSKARTFLTQPPIKQPCDFATLYPGANPLAIDLLAKSTYWYWQQTHTTCTDLLVFAYDCFGYVSFLCIRVDEDGI